MNCSLVLQQYWYVFGLFNLTLNLTPTIIEKICSDILILCESDGES